MLFIYSQHAFSYMYEWVSERETNIQSMDFHYMIRNLYLVLLLSFSSIYSVKAFSIDYAIVYVNSTNTILD